MAVLSFFMMNDRQQETDKVNRNSCKVRLRVLPKRIRIQWKDFLDYVCEVFYNVRGKERE